jgi:Chromatin modification-related protein EAF7
MLFNSFNERDTTWLISRRRCDRGTPVLFQTLRQLVAINDVFGAYRMADDDKMAFLNTVEGEVSFFRSVMRARPVGIHRHFHALTIRNSIHRDTGQSVSFEEIWRKLESLYNLDALDALVSPTPPPFFFLSQDPSCLNQLISRLGV